MRDLIRRAGLSDAVPSFLAGLTVLAGLSLTRLYGFLLFHSLAEVFSILVAFGIFTVFWNSRRFLDNGCFLFLGIAYLFVGLVDLLHTLAYDKMGVFSNEDYDASNLATQLWISARLIESLSILAAPLFLRRRFQPHLVLVAYAVVTSLLLGSIFLWRVFPDCYLKALTPFKKTTEYVICVILASALVLLLRRRKEFDARVFRLLCWSIVLTIASEVAFTLYQEVTGTPTLVGHLFKLVSFYLIYVAFVEVGLANPYAVVFRNLKESEQSFRESEARFRGTFDNAAVGIAHVDLDGRWLRVNQRLCDILGYSRQTVLQKRFQDLTHPDDPQQDQARFASLARGEIGSYSSEKRYLRGDGDVVWVEVTMALQRDPSGRPMYCIAVVQDVTRRKDAEKQLQAVNETLEHRVAERTFVAEQRAAQLRALASELTLAEQRERRRLARTLHDHLQQLLVAAKLKMGVLRHRTQDEPLQELLQQVKGLLDDSISASRSLTVELSPPILDEAGLAAALKWLAGQMYDKHGLQVELEADADAQPANEELRVLVFEAVRELLFNVVKHSQAGSAHVTMAKSAGQQVRVTVTDAGVGFDPSELDGEGRSQTGFGLFSIRERLGLMGGRLEVDATPGKGARMSILAPRLLPARPPDASQPAPQAGVAAIASGPSDAPAVRAVSRETPTIRVLLADDHELVREGLASLLREHPDIEVVGEAADGQTAVELAFQMHPHVVVMDVALPRLSGIEATRRITKHLGSARVIALSMHVEQHMAEAMRQAGAVAYLPKGAPSEDLVAAIRRNGRLSSEAPPAE